MRFSSSDPSSDPVTLYDTMLDQTIRFPKFSFVMNTNSVPTSQDTACLQCKDQPVNAVCENYGILFWESMITHKHATRAKWRHSLTLQNVPIKGL
jgi:hypothetical protein